MSANPSSARNQPWGTNETPLWIGVVQNAAFVSFVLIPVAWLQNRREHLNADDETRVGAFRLPPVEERKGSGPLPIQALGSL
jgi:hypothetical protein